MSNLVIVESPTKAKTLTRFLGDGYQITATMGHIRDLPENKLGIEIEKDFTPLYQVIATRTKSISELKQMASKAEEVILATDPDREGEAIAWHVSQVLKLEEKKAKRIVFHEITKHAVDDALQHPRTIDMRLVDAQQARRILDRLVGYKLSPVLWNKLGKRWLSAGRVQSVAVRLIVDREREIQNFKPVEYWNIEVELQKSGTGKNSSFTARLTEVNGKKFEVHEKKSADSIVSQLEGSTYNVESVETKETKRYPVAPFTTSTLQQAASNKFGWSAKRTMRAAQKLYEEGLITYHRTDSTNIAEVALSMVRGYIEKDFGKAFLPDSIRIYKTKSKVAQEAHEAIRPTNVSVLAHHDSKTISLFTKNKTQHMDFDSSLGRDQEVLYSLIWKRFVASQMADAIFDDTKVDIKAVYSSASFLFRANGRTMKFAGWLSLYGDTKRTQQKTGLSSEEKVNGENIIQEETDQEQQNELPVLIVSEILKLLQILPQQKFTEPPARYTEASLIKILEEKGIGRPSTYAPIISTIQDRKYVEKEERKFHPTDLGFAVNDFLVKYFPDVFDTAFTAKMEDQLDSIANGEVSWVPVMHEFYDPLAIKIEHVYKDADKVKVDLGETTEKCEKCGSSMVIRMSKFGKFLACSKFPDCKTTKNLLEKAGIQCPSCGGDIIVKKTRRGKQFYGCSNYPTCTFAAWKKEDILNKPASVVTPAS